MKKLLNANRELKITYPKCIDIPLSYADRNSLEVRGSDPRIQELLLYKPMRQSKRDTMRPSTLWNRAETGETFMIFYTSQTWIDFGGVC
jgi:hypothetical protein